MPRANPAYELQGHQHDEQSGGKNMQQRERPVRSKARVESRAGRKPWMLRRREKDKGAPHGYDEANGAEKKGQCPDEAGRTFGHGKSCRLRHLAWVSLA